MGNCSSTPSERDVVMEKNRQMRLRMKERARLVSRLMNGTATQEEISSNNNSNSTATLQEGSTASGHDASDRFGNIVGGGDDSPSRRGGRGRPSITVPSTVERSSPRRSRRSSFCDRRRSCVEDPSSPLAGSATDAHFDDMEWQRGSPDSGAAPAPTLLVLEEESEEDEADGAMMTAHSFLLRPPERRKKRASVDSIGVNLFDQLSGGDGSHHSSPEGRPGSTAQGESAFSPSPHQSPCCPPLLISTEITANENNPLAIANSSTCSSSISSSRCSTPRSPCPSAPLFMLSDDSMGPSAEQICSSQVPSRSPGCPALNDGAAVLERSPHAMLDLKMDMSATRSFHELSSLTSMIA